MSAGLIPVTACAVISNRAVRTSNDNVD